jgi:peptidoglycan/xylan/chitin deacetylase (PgdA/CDA1 family)
MLQWVASFDCCFMMQRAGTEQPNTAESVSPTARFPLRLAGVPVLNYHGLTESFSPDVPPAAQRFWLTPRQFHTQLTHIHQAGFRVADLRELKVGSSEHKGNTPGVVLTFDDGLASDYEFAFPLLAEFGMTGAFFVNTSTVGEPGYLTWTQISAMHRAGMLIGSHSHHHLDLTVLPTQTLERELADSKRCLEDHLGCAVEFLAAPHGLINRRMVDSAVAIGYCAVCSTRCWPAKPGSRVLTRITVHRDITPDEFHAFLARQFSGYARRLCRGLLYRPRRVTGHLWGIMRYRWLRQAAPVSK